MTLHKVKAEKMAEAQAKAEVKRIEAEAEKQSALLYADARKIKADAEFADMERRTELECESI